MDLIQRIAPNVILLAFAIFVGVVVVSLLHNQSYAQGLAQERNQTIVRECEAQNARHTATVNQLDALLATAIRKTPAKRAEITASREPTILLINALAPYQNCRQVLAKSTSTR